MESNLMKIVIVGHVDHGKSTLIGRLLLDSGSLPKEVQEKLIMANSNALSTGNQLASIMDSFEEEQSQCITIDTTQVRFHTKKRNYVIIDAPGHREFLKNMVSGAASADAAILLVDAIEGVMEQTKRHVYILSLLGISQIVVVINKMDSVGFDRDKFKSIQKSCASLFASLNLKPNNFIPICALNGDNVVSPSANMKWYKANTLVEELEGFKTERNPENEFLRFPVQDVYFFDNKRFIVGRVESGVFEVGDCVLCSPTNEKTIVKSIERWNAVDLPQIGSSGDSIAITLKDKLFVERGFIISHQNNTPILSSQFRANIFWMGDEPLKKNTAYKIKLTTQEVAFEIVSFDKIIDTITLDSVEPKSDLVNKYEVAEVTLKTKKPIAFDNFSTIKALGRFVIMNGNDVSGGGIITRNDYPDRRPRISEEVKNKNVVWHKTKLTRFDREKRNLHKGVIIWLTGLSSSGKSTIAMNLEYALFKRGIHAYILDGDNVRTGLNKDLGFLPDERAENIRRISEVSKLFMDAGTVVIAALISPYRVDRELCRKLVAKGDFIEIFIDCPIEVCEQRDPKGLYIKARRGEISNFTGISAPYEIPDKPEIHLRTDLLNVDEEVEKIILFLEECSYIPKAKTIKRS